MAFEKHKISNVKARWFKLTGKGDTKFNENGVWSVDLVLEDNMDAYNEVMKTGANPRQVGQDGEHIVTCKKNRITRKGDTLAPPRVVDSKGNPMTEEQIKRIGNGSTISVIVNPYKWDFAGKSGTTLFLEAVKVEELVEYKGAPDVDFDDLSPDVSDVNVNSAEVPF